MKVIPFRSSTTSSSRYPNGASRRYILEKLVDSLLAAAITLSVVTIAVFLLAM